MQLLVDLGLGDRLLLLSSRM